MQTTNSRHPLSPLHRRSPYAGAGLVQGLRLRLVQRPIASVLLLTSLSLFTLPAQAALQQYLNTPVSVAPPVHIANLSDALKDFHESLHRTERNAGFAEKKQAGASGLFTRLKNAVNGTGPDGIREQGAQDLLSRETKISQLENQTRKDFAATLDHLKKAHLPDVILQRHAAAVKTFEDRSRLLHGKLATLRAAETKGDSSATQAALADIDSTLTQWEPKPRQVDPHHLPWGSPSNKVRAPYTSKDEYLQHLSLFGVKPIQVAYNGSGWAPPGTKWPTLPTMGEAPVAGDLQATEDVQITPEIQALATQLDHNPVKIYQWVHNTIRYMPTYGSIQGADMTYQTQQGNDMDTASLLIALLRSANIPARYVYGTINVPVVQAENWVGGVNNADAVLNLLGQGGVPSKGLMQGGQVTQIQMEHVWVEAYVNYVPSRGWVNNGKGDTWVPLDASFKQFSFTGPKVNLKQALQIDPQHIMADAESGATIDPNGNYIQNINIGAIQNDIAQYNQSAQSYLAGQSISTVQDLLGSQLIVPYTAKALPITLPCSLVVVSADFSTLPSTLHETFGISLSTSDIGWQTGSPVINYTNDLVNLAGQFLSLGFKPATAHDENVIKSYFPSSNVNLSTFNQSQLAQTLPGYLINVVPVLMLNGAQVAVGSGSETLGSAMSSSMVINYPQGTGNPYINHAIAGQYYVIGIDAAGIGSGELGLQEQNLNQLSGNIQDQNLSNIRIDDTVGGVLHGALLNYFLTVDRQDTISKITSNIIENRMPSFGTYSTTLNVGSSYGVPISVGISGATLDIGYLSNEAVDGNNNLANLKLFNMEGGSRDSLAEAAVPQNFFSSTSQQVTSVSAITALQAATLAGQPIFTINSANAGSVISQLNLPQDVVVDIENAVSSGVTVIVSQSSVTIGGWWSGIGYEIVDPQTGSGAYIISGGANGGSANLTAGDYGVIFNICSAMTGMLSEYLKEPPPGWSLLKALAEPLAKLAAYFAIFSAVLSAMQAMWNASEKCKDTGEYAGAVALIMLDLMVQITIAFVGLAFGGLGWILYFTAGSYAMDALTDDAAAVCE